MNEKKEGYRFGWVDWLILLIVACAVFLGVYYWISRSNREEDIQAVTYTLCVPLDGSIDWERSIPENAAVMDQKGTMELGRVVSVGARPALQAVVSDQALRFVSIPDRIELLVSVRANAAWQRGDGFRVGDIRIAAGKTGDFRIGGLFAANASVISLEEV